MGRAGDSDGAGTGGEAFPGPATPPRAAGKGGQGVGGRSGDTGQALTAGMTSEPYASMVASWASCMS